MSLVVGAGLAILGWFCGALVNYLSDVLPWKRRLSLLFCPRCQAENRSLLYFMALQRCSGCGKLRPWRTWLVNLAYAGVALWLWQAPEEKLGFWLSLALLVYFGVVTVIDAEHRLILHPVSFFGAVLCLGLGIYRNGLSTTLLGGAAGFGSMLVLYWLGGVFLRIASQRRGEPVDDVALGFGDVNLSGVLGLVLGWPGIVVGLFLAILMGGVVSLVFLLVMLLLRRYKSFTALPYGPFLIGAAVLLLFFRGALASVFR